MDAITKLIDVYENSLKGSKGIGKFGTGHCLHMEILLAESSGEPQALAFQQ